MDELLTRVVNIYKEPCDIKITRAINGTVPYPPAPGCFGNPFNLKNYTREESIALFAAYFYKRVETDEVFRQAVLGLKNKRLGCCCHPKACHGDIIKEWLDKYEN